MSDSQKNFYKKDLGKKGETIAENFLRKNGYKIIQKNLRTPYGETDILAMESEYYVFIEVKTRTSDLFGIPCESVTENKRERYFKMANWYMEKKQEELNIRFDVIEVYSDRIELIKNAF